MKAIIYIGVLIIISTYRFFVPSSNFIFEISQQVGAKNKESKIEISEIRSLNKDTLSEAEDFKNEVLSNPPVADFYASNTAICMGTCIDFTNISSNNPTNAIWYFQGAWPESYTGNNPPTVCYNGAGIFSVSLFVSNAYGSDIEYKTSYITVFPIPELSIGTDTVMCVGDTLVLDAGSGGNTYEWYPSGNTQHFEITTSGSYSVTVVDENGCLSRDAIYISFQEKIEVFITSQDTTVCVYQPDFYLFASEAGGSWSGNGIIDTAEGLFSPEVAGAGIHEVVYTMNTVCAESDTILISVHSLPTVNFVSDTSICMGDTIELCGESSNMEYLWSTGDTTQCIYVMNEGEYWVNIIDSIGCQGTYSMELTVIEQKIAEIYQSGPYCNNEADVYLIVDDITGFWSGNGIIDSLSGEFSPEIAGVGIHQIIYEIPGLCGDTDTTYIAVLPAPQLELGNDTILCIGDSLVLTIDLEDVTYYWSTEDTTSSITIFLTGIYSITATNNYNCSVIDSIYVEVKNYLDASIITNGSFCSNDGLIYIEVIDSGGVWFNENGYIDSETGLFDTEMAGEGIHLIVYTIPEPCGSSDSVFITVNAAPDISFWNDTTICSPDSLILNAGGIESNTYLWSTGDTIQTIVVITEGTYSVTVSNDFCIASSSIEVQVEPQLDATIFPQGPFCADSNPVYFTAVDEGGEWLGEGISYDGLFDPVIAGPGEHIIMYSIDKICGDWDTVVVIVHEIPEFSIMHTDETCIGYSNGTATVSIHGHYPPYSVLWSTGETTEQIQNLTPGIYFVTVTDANFCTNVDSVEIDDGAVCKPLIVNCNGICNGVNGFFPEISGGDSTLSEITDIELVIFSRWGEIIFKSNDIHNKWFGDYKGRHLEPAVFVFVLKIRLQSGEVFTETGDVTLIR